MTNLSMLGGKKAKTPEIQRLGFGTDVFVNPPDVLGEAAVYATQVMRALADKTDVIEGPEFVHGEDNWLVLADSLGMEDWQLGARIESVSTLLRKFWKAGWYSKVFLQEQRFGFQVEFNPQGHVILPEWRRSRHVPNNFIFDED